MKISCLTQNFALSTNLDFLRKKKLISKKKEKGDSGAQIAPFDYTGFLSLHNFS